MRALFTTQPGFGHLNPVLPYAVALRDAGHEVRFASTRTFGEAIEQHGFACEPVGVDFTWERASEYFPGIDDAARAGRADEFAAFEVTWKLWNATAARDLMALFERWRPDVIVREFMENGATFAGELSGVPVVCAAWGALPDDRTSWQVVIDWDRQLSCYARVRNDLGLPPDPSGSSWGRQVVLSPLPPAWIRGHERPAEVRHFRVQLNESAGTEAPKWLASMGVDRPLVYATLGTVYNRLRRLRRAFLDAFADLDADVLLTIGRNVDPATIGAIPPNVRVEPFVAQSLVLPRAALVVSHAGLGTMLGAIYAGVPMVVVAVGADQPINARRATELGVADSLDFRDADATRLHAAAARALGDAGRYAASRALREECDAMDDVGGALNTLESVVRGDRGHG